MGALIMVQLMMVGGDNFMVKIIGKEFAAMASEHWVYFSPYLGAIDAFFSGLLICLIMTIIGKGSLYLRYVNPWFRIFGEGLAGILLCEYMPKIQKKVLL